jgi:hypothetical protein
MKCHVVGIDLGEGAVTLVKKRDAVNNPRRFEQN